MLHTPVISFVGDKHTGKTTLITRLLEIYSMRGLRVGCVKHDGHDFASQPGGTDTGKFLRAGAEATVVANSDGHALAEWSNHAMSLEQLMALMKPVDLVIVEGFKNLPIPKWVLLPRIEFGKSYQLPDFFSSMPVLESVQGFIVPESPLQISGSHLPVYHRDDIPSIESAIRYHA